MTQRRIGILGGSFNPPHLGHLEMARLAKEQLNLTQVWLMVSPQNPLKSDADMAPLADRMTMCEKLAAEHPWLQVTDIERRLGTRYTADTLEKLINKQPTNTFFWLMGDDNLKTFHKWDNWQKIAAMVPLVVFRRTEDDSARQSPAAKSLAAYEVPPESPEETPPNWRVLTNTLMPVSATELRQAPETKSDFLPPEISAYIQEKNLYTQPRAYDTEGT